MKNIAQIFGKPTRKELSLKHVEWPLPEQMIGVEIEAESMNGEAVMPNAADMINWAAQRDGSLRKGTEFVLRSPLKGDILATAIGEIFAPPTKFVRSATGSTHIHLDMTEENTTAELVKSITLIAYCLESAIFNIADPGREWCGFTNRLTSGPEIIIGSVLAESDGENFEHLYNLCSGQVMGVNRYYGLNLLSLHKYGSIEFRYFPTATSPEELISWVKLVMCIKKAAATYKVEELFPILMTPDSYIQFVRTYFYEWREAFMRHAPPYLARETAHKALVAALSCNFVENPATDMESVFKNEVFKKYVKKGTKVGNCTYPMLFLGPEESVPVGDIQQMTVMVMTADIHIRIGDRWHYALEHSPAFTPLIMKNLYRTLERAQVPEGPRFTRWRDTIGYHMGRLGTMMGQAVAQRASPTPNFLAAGAAGNTTRRVYSNPLAGYGSDNEEPSEDPEEYEVEERFFEQAQPQQSGVILGVDEMLASWDRTTPSPPTVELGDDL